MWLEGRDCVCVSVFCYYSIAMLLDDDVSIYAGSFAAIRRDGFSLRRGKFGLWLSLIVIGCIYWYDNVPEKT
jgi:hypothetical protein